MPREWLGIPLMYTALPIDQLPDRVGDVVARKRPATSPSDADVDEFVRSIPDQRRRIDTIELIQVMTEVTGEPPRMWGSTIIGFGNYHYRYESGHEGDSAIASFSPRKQHLVIYLIGGFEARHTRLLDKLGKFKTSKGLPVHQVPQRHRPRCAAPVDRPVCAGARWNRPTQPTIGLIPSARATT